MRGDNRSPNLLRYTHRETAGAPVCAFLFYFFSFSEDKTKPSVFSIRRPEPPSLPGPPPTLPQASEPAGSPRALGSAATAMASAGGDEAAGPSVAVAVSGRRSRRALRWAAENLIPDARRVVLLHVITALSAIPEPCAPSNLLFPLLPSCLLRLCGFLNCFVCVCARGSSGPARPDGASQQRGSRAV